MASLWPDLAQDAARRVNGARCRLRLPTAEQLPSSGGATEREEEGGSWQRRERKKGGRWQRLDLVDREVVQGRSWRRCPLQRPGGGGHLLGLPVVSCAIGSYDLGKLGWADQLLDCAGRSILTFSFFYFFLFLTT
jgi:hypothetical protein